MSMPHRIVASRQPSPIARCPRKDCNSPLIYEFRWLGGSVLLERCQTCAHRTWVPISPFMDGVEWKYEDDGDMETLGL